jgi:hypothetical protein
MMMIEHRDIWKNSACRLGEEMIAGSETLN